MTRLFRILMQGCLFASAALSACSLAVPNSIDKVAEGSPAPYNTITALLTATAVVTQPEPTVAQATATPTSDLAGAVPITSSSPTPLSMEESPAASSNTIPCNLVQPGTPFDVNIPDDTRLAPGEYFAKTWRLVNAGNCTWDNSYTVVWFSGESLGIHQTTYLAGEVLPGSAVDVTVDMLAPQQPGVYQSNWKMRAADGSLFGIGPNGDSPFWTRIVVEHAETPTATATASVAATPTEVIFASGAVILSVTDGVDLDSGMLNQSTADDLTLRNPSEGNWYLVPENGARLMQAGAMAPQLAECSGDGMSEAPLDLGVVVPGSYFCYRTNGGLPGRAYVSTVDLETGALGLEFITWVVP